MEVDVIAESLDKTSLLVGEAKWQEQMNIDETLFTLQRKVENLPFRAKYQHIVLAVWTKHAVDTTACHVITPEGIL